MKQAAEIRIRVGGVYVKDDKILLVRHEKNKKTYWLLPGGGCEFGESLKEALEREVKEETSLESETGIFLFSNESIPPDKHRHVVNFTFLGEITGGEIKVGESEDVVKEATWVSKEELAKLTFYPNFKQLLLEFWDEGFKASAISLGNLWED